MLHCLLGKLRRSGSTVYRIRLSLLSPLSPLGPFPLYSFPSFSILLSPAVPFHAPCPSYPSRPSFDRLAVFRVLLPIAVVPRVPWTLSSPPLTTSHETFLRSRHDPTFPTAIRKRRTFLFRFRNFSSRSISRRLKIYGRVSCPWPRMFAGVVHPR